MADRPPVAVCPDCGDLVRLFWRFADTGGWALPWCYRCRTRFLLLDARDKRNQDRRVA